MLGHAVWHVCTAVAIYIVWRMAEADRYRFWRKVV